MLADLGTSTRQLLAAERGFSFSKAGPLDMRMDETSAQSLRTVLDQNDPDSLGVAIHRVTDQYPPRSVCRKLYEALGKGEIHNTLDLSGLFPRFKKPHEKHAATVFFLGLRMLVNEEWEEVEQGLPRLFEHLKPGGRLAVITFHSTEDRLVKKIFKFLSGSCVCEEPICRCPKVRQGTLITKKPIEPSEAEVRANPRARSAKLRVIERL